MCEEGCLLNGFFFKGEKEELIRSYKEISELFSANITSWQHIHKGFVHCARKKKKKYFKCTKHDHVTLQALSARFSLLSPSHLGKLMMSFYSLLCLTGGLTKLQHWASKADECL